MKNKILVIIVLCVIAFSPLISNAVSGMIEYQSISLSGSGGKVTKTYDYDEKVVCYTITYNYASAGGISCVKDN